MAGPPPPRQFFKNLFEKQDKHLKNLNYHKVICSSFFQPKIDYFYCDIVVGTNNVNYIPIPPVVLYGNPNTSEQSLKHYYNNIATNIMKKFNSININDIYGKINAFNNLKDEDFKAYRINQGGIYRILFYKENYNRFLLNDIDNVSVLNQIDSFYTNIGSDKVDPRFEQKYNLLKFNVDEDYNNNKIPIYKIGVGTDNRNFINNHINPSDENLDNDRIKISDNLVNMSKHHHSILESNIYHARNINDYQVILGYDVNSLNLFEMHKTNINVYQLRNNNYITTDYDKNTDITTIKQHTDNSQSTYYNSYLINYFMNLIITLNQNRDIPPIKDILKLLKHEEPLEKYNDIIDQIIPQIARKITITTNISTDFSNYIFINQGRDTKKSNRKLNVIQNPFLPLAPIGDIKCEDNIPNYCFMMKIRPDININDFPSGGLRQPKFILDNNNPTKSFTLSPYYGCIYVDNTRKRILAYCPTIEKPNRILLRKLIDQYGKKLSHAGNYNKDRIEEIYDIVTNKTIHLGFSKKSSSNRSDMFKIHNIYAKINKVPEKLNDTSLIGTRIENKSIGLNDYSQLYCLYFLMVMSTNMTNEEGVPISSMEDPFTDYFDKFFRYVDDFKDKNGVIDNKEYYNHVERVCKFIGNILFTGLDEPFSEKNFLTSSSSKP